MRVMYTFSFLRDGPHPSIIRAYKIYRLCDWLPRMDWRDMKGEYGPNFFCAWEE